MLAGGWMRSAGGSPPPDLDRVLAAFLEVLTERGIEWVTG